MNKYTIIFENLKHTHGGFINLYAKSKKSAKRLVMDFIKNDTCYKMKIKNIDECKLKEGIRYYDFK